MVAGLNDSTVDSRHSAAVIAQAASMVAIIIVAVTGNVLILTAIYIDKTLQTITNAFIINLACADLLLAIIGMPFTLASSITYEWIFGDTWCKVNGMANSLFCIASILTLAAVSLDRYFAILYPFRYGRWITKKMAGCMIFYIWFHALLMACLPVMGWSRYTFIRSESICTVHWEFDIAFTVSLFSVCFFLPLGVMMFTYLRIFRTARIQSKKIVPVTGQIESKEAEPSISVNPRGENQAHLYCPDNPTTSEFLNKSWFSLNSSVHCATELISNQSQLTLYEGHQVEKSNTENSADAPSKDSGFEERFDNTSSLFPAKNTTVPPEKVWGSWSSTGGVREFSSSYTSVECNKENVFDVPMKTVGDNIDSTQKTSTQKEVEYMSKVVNLNSVCSKGKSDMKPLPSPKRYEEKEFTEQNLLAKHAQDKSGVKSNNNSKVNKSIKPHASSSFVEHSYVTGPKDTVKEDNGNIVRELMSLKENFNKDQSVNKNSSLCFVISASGPPATPRSFPGMVHLTSTDRPKESTTSHHRKKTSTGSSQMKRPHAFRAFSKSSLVLMKLRKKKEVQSRANMRRETKAAKTLLTVVGTFILCWTPHFVGIFCFLFEKCSWPDSFFAITTWLAMLNSACNPVIYGVMSRQFRRRFKQILQCNRSFF